jgi:hypothetical protein
MWNYQDVDSDLEVELQAEWERMAEDALMEHYLFGDC